MGSKNLGEILLEQGLISREALDHALQIQNRRLGEILVAEQLADPVDIAQALKVQAKDPRRRRTARLTIEARTLDALLARIENIEDQIATQRATDPMLAQLIALREQVEWLLLEPVDTLFEKARQVAEQAARETSRKVQLICHGGGLIVDRSIVEELSDLVLHLVRNAVDHGFSSRPEGGTIRFTITLGPGRLLVTIADDGSGIDEQAVYEQAVKQGLLVKPRDHVSSPELHQLLFTPGFSTRATAGALSGRGVGLDVVEAGALRLGGKVSVRSAPAQGAAFTISVPLAYAKLPIVPLRAGREWLAVNAADITHIEKVSGKQGLFPAAPLFGSPPAESGAECIKVQSALGTSWAFDEVGQPEDVLVREATDFSDSTQHAVVGGARLRNGTSLLVIDLALLSRMVTTSGSQD